MILFFLDHTSGLTDCCLRHSADKRKLISRVDHALAAQHTKAGGVLTSYRLKKPVFADEFREQVTHLYALGMITIIPEMSDSNWKEIVDLKPTFDAALRTSILSTPIGDLLPAAQSNSRGARVPARV